MNITHKQKNNIVDIYVNGQHTATLNHVIHDKDTKIESQFGTYIAKKGDTQDILIFTEQQDMESNFVYSVHKYSDNLSRTLWQQ